MSPIPPNLLKGLTRPSQAHGPCAPVTEELLEAGSELLEEALEHDPDSGAHPFLSFLSRPNVTKRATARGKVEAKVSTMKDTWAPHWKYVDDLMRWVMHHRPEQIFPKREEEFVEEAEAGEFTPSKLIRGLSRKVQHGLFSNPMFRMQLVALAATASPRYRKSKRYSEDDDIVNDMRRLYTVPDAQYGPIIHGFLQSHNISLRKEFDERDIVETLTAIGEGLALRELADPTTGNQRLRRLNLQGAAALAIIYAWSDRTGDHRPLDELVDEMAQGPSSQ